MLPAQSSLSVQSVLVTAQIFNIYIFVYNTMPRSVRQCAIQ